MFVLYLHSLFYVFTFLKKSEKSLAAWGLADPGNPDSAMVSCRNSAISNRTLSNLRFFSSYFGYQSFYSIYSFLLIQFTPDDLLSYVLGNILGNSLRATGNNNSIKGTMTKTANGTKRKMSDVVRRNYEWSEVKDWRHNRCIKYKSTWRASLRVKYPPFNSFHVSLEEIRISSPSNLVPSQ